ncbi:MAG: iron chelate uptake ABC transporter family permease subunit [Opitutae bacterium]|nr:iron chelate uptake ABC transporter family permease subunit [Opitutae bacterium]
MRTKTTISPSPPLTIGLLALALVAIALVATALGPQGTIHPWVIVKSLALKAGLMEGPMSAESIIVWNLRLPRVLGAVLVGGSLAVSGALIQTLFRNPLAEPFLIGISSGSAFGAVISVALGYSLTGWSGNATTLSAFCGGVGVSIIVYNLSRRGRRIAMTTLLLTGIAIGGVLQSITTFLLLNYELQQIRSLMGWMMGSLAFFGWEQVALLAPYTLAGVSAAWFYHRELNLLALGDHTAQHLGLSLERTRLLLLVIATLLASATVALCGIIAFVGLMVPHIVRMLVGANHKQLIPASICAGGILLILADITARTARSGQEIPIGIITSILGGIFFVMLIRMRSPWVR